MVTNPSSVDIEERERVLQRAEQDKAFAAVGHALSELVESMGIPEYEIVNALLYTDELAVLFRILRTAAEVNRRLSGDPMLERCTHAEWEKRSIALPLGRTHNQRMLMEQMLHMQNQQSAGLDMAPGALTEISDNSSKGIKMPDILKRLGL